MKITPGTYLMFIILAVILLGGCLENRVPDTSNASPEGIPTPCFGECTADECRGTDFIACVGPEGCKIRINASKTRGNCGVECVLDADCPAAKICDEYKCTTPKSCPPSCDDGNICTLDHCSGDTHFECGHDSIPDCCGNGRRDASEGCSSCPIDAGCSDDEMCCKDNCIRLPCSNDSECNDSNDDTIDTCLHRGTCNCECFHEVITHACAGGDNLCPKQCNAFSDPDCPVYKFYEKVRADMNTDITVKGFRKITCTTTGPYVYSHTKTVGNYIVIKIKAENSGGSDGADIDIWDFYLLGSNGTKFVPSSHVYGDECGSEMEKIYAGGSLAPGTAREGEIFFDAYEDTRGKFWFVYDPSASAPGDETIFKFEIYGV